MMRDAKPTPSARANLDQGFSLLRKHAESGNAFAQSVCHDLAVDTGILSHDVADIWLRRSAEQGYPEAEYKLAQHYDQGQGSVGRDIILALSWMRKAADHNYGLAQYGVGSIFQYGPAWPKILPRAEGGTGWPHKTKRPLRRIVL